MNIFEYDIMNNLFKNLIPANENWQRIPVIPWEKSIKRSFTCRKRGI